MSSNNNKQFKYCAKNLGLKQTYITWYRISITNLHQGCVNDPRSCEILVRFYLTLNRALWRAVIHCKTSFKYLVMFLTVCQCIYVFFELNMNVYKPLKVQQKEFRNKSMSLFILQITKYYQFQLNLTTIDAIQTVRRVFVFPSFFLS